MRLWLLVVVLALGVTGPAVAGDVLETIGVGAAWNEPFDKAEEAFPSGVLSFSVPILGRLLPAGLDPVLEETSLDVLVPSGTDGMGDVDLGVSLRVVEAAGNLPGSLGINHTDAGWGWYVYLDVVGAASRLLGAGKETEPASLTGTKPTENPSVTAAVGPGGVYVLAHISF